MAIADRVLDSSQMNVHQLRRWVVTELASDTRPGLSLLVQSFAYRHGVPGDADFVFDALPAESTLGSAPATASGRDAPVNSSRPGRHEYLGHVSGFPDHWLRFESDTRSYA